MKRSTLDSLFEILIEDEIKKIWEIKIVNKSKLKVKSCQLINANLVNSSTYCILLATKTTIMKNIFQTEIKAKYLNLVILLFRITVAVFMLTHGWPKLNKLLAGGEIQFGDPLGMGATPSLVLAVFAEFLCSVFIAFGFGTRLATLPLIITMSVAAFIVHGADPFGRKELALMYLLIYIFLFVVGSGKFSVDYYLTRKNRKSK